MPGGDAAGFPIVNVPPIFTGVRAGGETLVLNGDAGFELPIAKVTVPPLLPVNVALGPFVIEIKEPGAASTSMML